MRFRGSLQLQALAPEDVSRPEPAWICAWSLLGPIPGRQHAEEEKALPRRCFEVEGSLGSRV